MSITDPFVNPLADEVTLGTPLVTADRRRLLLQYEVANDMSESIYLVNRIAVWTWQGLSLDPNLVYTEILGDRLRLSKALIDIPQGETEDEVEAPYFSEVAPGALFTEMLEVPLPLEPFHPFDAVTSRDEVHRFDQVELAVGWLAESEVDIQLAQGQEGQILIAADSQQVRRAQQLLVMTLPVSVPAYFGPSNAALSQ
ncbi:MAG: hypothetical protein PVG33_06275 [Chloroflexota bacterium]|jgi:hypothetical protein